MKKRVYVFKSPNPKKKWRALFVDDGKKVDFGAAGYSDYTKHKEHERMLRYVQRHKGMHEHWTSSGRFTPGFWARWLLWSKPSFSGALGVVRSKLPGYTVTLGRS